MAASSFLAHRKGLIGDVLMLSTNGQVSEDNNDDAGSATHHHIITSPIHNNSLSSPTLEQGDTASTTSTCATTVFARQALEVLSNDECRYLVRRYAHCRTQWDRHNNAASSTMPLSEEDTMMMAQLSIDPTLHESRGLTANDAGLKEWCRQHIVKKKCVPLLAELFTQKKHDSSSSSISTPSQQQHQHRLTKPPSIDTTDFYAFFIEGNQTNGRDDSTASHHDKDVHVDESVVTFLFTLHAGTRGNTTTTAPPVLEVNDDHGDVVGGVERVPLVVGSVVCFPGMLPHRVIEPGSNSCSSNPLNTEEGGGNSSTTATTPTTLPTRLQLVIYTKPLLSNHNKNHNTNSKFRKRRENSEISNELFFDQYEWYLSQKYLKASRYTNSLAVSFSIPSMPEWCRQVGLKWIQHLALEKQQQQLLLLRQEEERGSHQLQLPPTEAQEETPLLPDADSQKQKQYQEYSTTTFVVKAATHFSQVSELLEMIVGWCGPHRGADQIAMSEVCTHWNRTLCSYWEIASPARWQQRRIDLTQISLIASSSGGGGGGGGRQHVVISIGGLGNATAAHFWESIAVGAGLDTTGRRLTASSSSNNNNNVDDGGIVEDAFFHEVHASGQYRPRGVLVDTASCWDNPSDELRYPSSSYSSPFPVFQRWRHLFAPDQFAFGKEGRDGGGTGHIWADGMYSSHHQSVVDEAIDAIRRQVEGCSSMAGFIMLKGVGGGTCGITSRLILSEHFPRITKIGGATITPSFTLDKYPHMAAYNACLALGGGVSGGEMDALSASVLFGNGALHHHHHHRQNGGDGDGRLYNPYTSCQLASRCLQSITTSMRLDGALNLDVNEFVTNHVPYPRVQFLTVGHAPLYHRIQRSTQHGDEPYVAELCSHATDFHNHLHSDISSSSLSSGGASTPTSSTNSTMGKYMAMSLLFHGNVAPKDVMAAVSTIKTKRTLQFVDWCPTGFKCGINYSPLGFGPSSSLSLLSPRTSSSSSSSPSTSPFPPRSVTSISNTTAICDVFSEIHHRASTLYSKRSFVHHYVQAGMEEGEMSEALENLAALEQDYEEVGMVPSGDDDDEEEY